MLGCAEMGVVRSLDQKKCSLYLKAKRQGNVVNNNHKLIGKQGNAGTKESRKSALGEGKKTELANITSLLLKLRQ